MPHTGEQKNHITDHQTRSFSIRAKSWGRLLNFVGVLMVALFWVLALTTLMQDVQSDKRPQTEYLHDTISLMPPATGIYEENHPTPVFRQQQTDPYSSSMPTLDLTIDRILPTERRVKVKVRLYIPEEVRKRIVNIELRREGIVRPSRFNDYLELKPQYRNLVVNLNFDYYLFDKIVPNDGQVTVPITLKELFPQTPPRKMELIYPEYVTNIDLPLVGQPSLYPSDWYILNTHPSIRLPYPLDYNNADGSGSYWIGVDARIALGLDMADKKVLLKVQRAHNIHKDEGISVYITRADRTIIYTYAMACLPLVLGALCSPLLFLINSDMKEQFASVVIGLAALMLAIPECVNPFETRQRSFLL